jgi:Putative lysophospholipase.
MEKQTEWLKMDDGMEIYTACWPAKNAEPMAVVQIAHGMAEHIGRYDDFARFLAGKGITVIGGDHRGHGHTGERAGLFGYFSDQNGFERVVEDLWIINQHIRKKFPGIPIILLGHSMGSFLARRYIQKYPDTVIAAIFSGTGGNPGILGKAGLWLAKREMKKNGKKSPSPAMDRLIFGSYNKQVENVATRFDWISRDRQVVEAYVADPFCGFICTSGFFYDLLWGLLEIHKDANIRKTPADFPILFLSGEKDPVGGYTRGVKQAIRQYEKNGMTNISCKFYPDGRHEMLNEINKNEVYEDVFRWIREVLDRSE